MKTKEEIKECLNAGVMNTDQLASWIHALQTPEPEWLPIPKDRNVPLPAFFPSNDERGWVIVTMKLWVPANATHYCPITPPKPMPKPDAFDEVIRHLPNLPEHAKSQEAALALLRHVWDAALEHARQGE